MHMVWIPLIFIFTKLNTIVARQTAGGVALDSPKNFLPPEALQGGKIDPKCDIWMLGCTVSSLTISMVLLETYFLNYHGH
jgi:hypothetical protein